MSFIQGHTNPPTPPPPHTHTLTLTYTHWAAKGDIYVCLALLKSLVSVKLNLCIIITCKTTESYFSSLAPTSTEIQRKGSGVTLIGRGHTWWTRRGRRVAVGSGEGTEMMSGSGEERLMTKKERKKEAARERKSGSERKWQDISCTDSGCHHGGG